MKRKFRVVFGRSVATSGRPDVMEVLVQSLSTSSNALTDITFPPVDEIRKIALGNATNVAEFDLEPSYQPGLDRPILYRVTWRKSMIGRVETTDFTMPNADITYDDLFDLGAIVGSEVYLREEDLGVIGRVAKLNDDGLVVDAFGNVVSGSEGIGQLEQRLTVEEQERRAGDLSNRAYAAQQLELQINSVISTTNTKIAAAIAEFRAADLSEKTAREQAIAGLNTYITSVVAEQNGQLSALGSSLATLQGTMVAKADLIGGKIPTSQIPSIALGTAVSVDTQAQMLALTTEQVQPGDFAIRPDSTWILISANPASLSSWKRLAVGGGVTTVNGMAGAVVLAAADVGARPVGVALNISEVTNLTAELAAKLTQADLQSIQTALGTKANSSELVTLRNEAVLKTAQGLVPTTLLGADVPLVNGLNQLVKKDGTVLSTGGGSGAVASVNGKVGTVVLVAGDVGARDVTVKVPLDDVEGLVAALAGKASTATTTNLASRLSTAEADIDALQAGEGGGTGGARNTVSWGDDGSDNIETVFARSPFGRTAGGTLYYDHLGVVDAEAVVPYVNISGALTFRKLDLNAAPDPAWARASDLTALTALVGGKADQTALDAVAALVAAKATQADLDALTAVVGTKATTAALNQLQATVANKADQADLDAANLAIQDRVDVETYTVRQTSIDQQLGTKYQLPAGGIPQATLDSATRTKIDRGDAAKTTVDAATATAAATSLVKTDGSGLFTVSPATAAAHPYQKSQVDNLLNLKVSTTDLTPLLAAKADLVGGKIPTSQIPAIATHETYAVANRAAMLALTPAQVQIGDVAIITGTADQGTYTLITADPTNFNNWLKHLSPADVVQSVNGYQGTIVLNAADVGARSASVAIPLADVSGLSAALAAKADTTYVNTQVATRTTPTQVTDQVSQLGTSKLAVDLAATGPVGSLSGQQSIDSTIAPLDSRVLLPMQNSSTQNGIWIVKTGAWVRATDMASGSSLMPYTLVAVKGGATNIDSLWQVTTTAPVTVDSAAQNYAKILRGGLPKTYTGGNGVDITGTVVSAKAAPGGNIIVASDGIKLDFTGLVRGMVFPIPAGSATVTIPHGLNSLNIIVQVRDAVNGDNVDVGATVTGLNTASVEFESAPGSGQWIATVIAVG